MSELSGLEVSSADGDVRYVPVNHLNHPGIAGGDFCAIAHESRYQWAVERYDLTGKTVLDFGCGSGYGCALLSEHAETVVGIDLSKTAIQFARQRYGNHGTQFFEADLEQREALEFLERKFDVIISFDVIEHTETYYSFMQNISRMLSPDGVAAVGCPNRHQTFQFNNAWNPYHLQEFTPRQLRWLASLYFSSCELIGQDFRDPDRRRQIANIRKSAGKKRSGLAKVARKWQKLVRKRHGKPSQSSMLTMDDMLFYSLNETALPAQQPFGLICECRRPKQADEETGMRMQEDEI